MSARGERWVLVALFLASLAWNALGIERLLPYDPEPDNYCAVQVQELEARVPVEERMDKFRSYPLGLAALARALPRFEAAPSAPKAEHLRAASDVSLRVRLVAVLLSSLLAPATFLFARRFLPPWGALAAALFAATSLLDQLFAAQGRPHGPLVALAVLSVVATLRLLRGPSLGAYALVGVAIAAATSTLQTGVFGLVPLVVAHRWILRERRFERGRAWAGLALAFALVVLAYVVTRADGPSLASESGVRGTSLRIGSHYFEATLLNGRGFLDFLQELWMHDPVLLVLGLAGVLLALPTWKRWYADPETCVAGSYALVYLGLWGFYGWTYDRYWLPLVPFLAFLTARVLVVAVERLRPRESALRRVVASALVLGAFALPAWASVAFARLRVAPDTIEEAAAWLEREADPAAGRIAVTPQLNVPVWYTERALREPDVPKLTGAWMRYQRGHALDDARAPRFDLVNLPTTLAAQEKHPDAAALVAWMDAVDPAYVVYEATLWNRDLEVVQMLYARMRDRGYELVHASPELGAGYLNRRTDLYQRVLGCLRRVLTLDRLGSRIEIWRAPPRN